MITKTIVLSEDQRYCEKALAFWAGGYHHLPKVHDFGVGICINYYGDLATFDFDRLTALVIIAHARAVRVEIASSGPRMVRIIAHRRKHGDRDTLRQYERHPDLNDLIQRIEKAKETQA